MAQDNALLDSTDWNETPLALFAPLDASLRCQVCKDFLDNPVMTSCCHTFCSLCIRRCLSSTGHCPTCRANDQETKLRRNWAMEDTVDSFRRARASALELARRVAAAEKAQVAEKTGGRKRRRFSGNEVKSPPESIADSGPSGKRRSSRIANSESQASYAIDETVQAGKGEDEDEVMIVADSSKEDEDFEPNDGLVACPSCQKRMKDALVFTHLDHCSGPQPQPQQQQHPSTPSSSRIKPPPPTPERLPSVNYSLFSDSALRKKLRSIGIPDFGPKHLLQRRHTEWMNLWNSNCDSRNPKTKQFLLRDLEVWEKTQGGRTPATTFVNVNAQLSGSNDSAKSDQIPNDQTMSPRDVDTFRMLIAQAQQRRDAARKARESRAEADSEKTKTDSDKVEGQVQIDEKDEKVRSTNDAGMSDQGTVTLPAGTNSKETQPPSI